HDRSHKRLSKPCMKSAWLRRVSLPRSLMRILLMAEGVVARRLPAWNPDDPLTLVSGRRGRHAESYVYALTPWRHMLADEGSYYTANNTTIGTGVVQGGTDTTISDVKACFCVQNTDQPSNTAAKSIYLDYLRMIIT